jgi:hypothetical protein
MIRSKYLDQRLFVYFLEFDHERVIPYRHFHPNPAKKLTHKGTEKSMIIP